MFSPRRYVWENPIIGFQYDHSHSNPCKSSWHNARIASGCYDEVCAVIREAVQGTKSGAAHACHMQFFPPPPFNLIVAAAVSRLLYNCLYKSFPNQKSRQSDSAEICTNKGFFSLAGKVGT